MPSMGDNLAVKVRYTDGSRKCGTIGSLAKGKGVHREEESEGLEPVGFPEAKSRADEQKPHMRQCKADEFATQNEVQKAGEEENRLRFYCPNLAV